ncbi:thiol oxidoreductase [Mesorhizobium sp. LSJC268A00]|uniref:di-heme oxidoreductase family protein n=1 Tax=unclassified Mesorhizobium TaxID=325217 RepID=UPI0003CEA2D3|nr:MULTISPECIES: di-heme oxidoredictase family protein [unclassified Mesorhizobium]ESX04700.1 thiol oxidoreductase [Mesorhizobium sp. LSJC268A00]ESY04211.1 thiol oxidoreductase [Mesorhizobium sp. LNJC399B00]ESY11457.1 thiol oxidoreductase [Mesorhizobium sp. LNJC398B00]ESY37662.1 thiol oxidoreductase [Mesorhizobium sp. LNJC386A00]ESZ13321.1 thiol oxidoreductase [Mesorhizobium sp. L2C085B000]
MRRPIDILRRLRRAAGPLLLKNPRYQAFRGLSVVTLAAILAPALAGSSEPVGLATSRTDLTPKDQARVLAVTRPTQDFSKPESFETMQGGAGTSRKQVDRDAFSQPSENITFEEQGNFKLGNALFRKNWVSSPSSTQASDGLGPLFNERACQNCHLKDGRGRPPAADSRTTSMFLRLARDASTAEEKAEIAVHKVLNFPDPVYGAQLQELAVPGLKGEGRMYVDYRKEKVTLGDGSIVSLRKPSYSLDGLGYGPLDPRTTLSPRLTPPMIGLGLIEQIAPADILAHADPDDRDGISGKPNMVRDLSSGQLTLGRFGWKAQTASIRQQAADAFAGDIGISTPEEPSHWGDCTAAEEACLAMPNGVQKRLGPVEAPPPVMDLVTFYSQNLAVPARRDVGAPAVLAGKKLFYEMGCIACHTPKFVTMRGNKAQAFQLIWPYSDFLLHDMGPGLADGQAVGDATGSEWRTPPLWGIGLTKTVNGNAFFLHDGRARTLTEAILWHGGEGQKARDRFAAANTADRDALIKFLESF